MMKDSAFLVRTRTRGRWPLSTPLFNIASKVSATTIKQQQTNKYKKHPDWKENVYSLTIWFVESPVKSIKKLLEVISEFGKVAEDMHNI